MSFPSQNIKELMCTNQRPFLKVKEFSIPLELWWDLTWGIYIGSLPRRIPNVLNSVVVKAEALGSDPLGLKLCSVTYLLNKLLLFELWFHHLYNGNNKIPTWEGCRDFYELKYVKCLVWCPIFGKCLINVYFYYI